MGMEGAYPEPPIPSSIDISKQKEVLFIFWVIDVSTADDSWKWTGKSKGEGANFRKCPRWLERLRKTENIWFSGKKTRNRCNSKINLSRCCSLNPSGHIHGAVPHPPPPKAHPRAVLTLLVLLLQFCTNGLACSWSRRHEKVPKFYQENLDGPDHWGDR